MSVQFGSWDFHHCDKEPVSFGQLREQLAPYGPDGESRFHDAGIDIIVYRLRETESVREGQQQYRIGTSQVFTWDGRLDNRDDLIRELDGRVHSSESDVVIAAAAYVHWGLACLPKLVGDWALSIWDSRKQELLLAKDFLGARPLFYLVDKRRVQWCSILDPLVLFAGRKFALDREYIAGWFGTFPASHLTPYAGVYAVPPASYVVVRKNALEIREFWRFSSKQLIYRTDAQYEDHFRQLFKQSVKRRLRSHAPVLAELSGGMDSSSIVCMADEILQSQEGLTPRLDTISYYSAHEPNWDELPYVSKVEELRGRKGTHLQVQTGDFFSVESPTDHFMATPGSLEPASKGDFALRRVLSEGSYRVLLSGIGGDEVLGGVPAPSPLLADLIVSGRWVTLGRELLAWALALRVPLARLLLNALAQFLTAHPASGAAHSPAWLSQELQKVHGEALRGYPQRIQLFGSRPSFQDNLHTLEALRRQLSCYPLSARPTYRKLYPYLDRDLLEFLFAIPPDQLLRPGRRRSLMRRALTGVVPQEVLDRRRKAFVIREPLAAITSEQSSLTAIAEEMLGSSLGIIDSRSLVATLRDVGSGGAVAVPHILRVFAIERWFRSVAHWKVLEDLDVDFPRSALVVSATPNSQGREFKTSLS